MSREDGSGVNGGSGAPLREPEAPLGGVWLFVVALAATAVLAAVAWVVAGRPPLIGIDDAAITRNYAENLARGHGFVYYVGGERVEGATSFLWTVLVAGTYLATPSPEFLIIALSAALTAVAVFAVLSLTALAARQLKLPQRPAVGLVVLGLAGLPGYFFWTVWTMMEVALWSATLLVLVWRLARLAERPRRWSFGLIVPALLLPLIRPEGAAAALGLLVLGGVLMGRWPRGLLTAIGATVVATAAITVFRLVYFGWPFPNTFYAKVSSDRLQDMIDGAKYLFSFVTGFPFAEVLLLIWAAAAVWALGRQLSGRPEGARTLLVAGAAIVGVFAVYGALGGDHFAYWRFLMPVTPLLVVAPALGLVALLPALRSVSARPVRALAAAAAGIAWIGVAYADLRQARFDLVKEFTLVEQGLAFGALANGLEPRPTLGVGPAGGISLSYEGPILDLLGLNWVEMAHANPIKTGMRNHASFDDGTFWKHEPDLVAEFNRFCADDDFTVRRVNENMTKGLYLEDRFQTAYAPVRIHDGDRCWRGFALRDWLAEISDPGIEAVDWSAVELRLAE